ncbi:MAG: DUF3604 domain-containing protein [Candidatus Korobacteraceae bacterium]
MKLETLKPETLKPDTSLRPAKPLENFYPGPPPIPAEFAGHCELNFSGDVEAGSWQNFTLTYTAGPYGMDDTASLKLVFRFASDQTAPQTTDPKAPGYLTAEASNGATLSCRFDYKQNVRPWDRTVHIKVVKGCMAEGEIIVIRLGDTRFGSPGMRVQTFADPAYEFRVLADPIACYHFAQVPEQPTIAIIPGARARAHAVLPALWQSGERFRLCVKTEDRWGNPSGKGEASFAVSSNLPVLGLPGEIVLREGEATAVIDGLSSNTPGDLLITLSSADGWMTAVSNALRLTPEALALRPYWADLHGQSAETIGTGTATDYFSFARDKAFLDVSGHQGNDFQITQQFWAELGQLCSRFNVPGRFVTMPGYEWSGNTSLGGDRNVYFMRDDRPIRRSSHALVPDHSDLATDCRTATELFSALTRDREDALIIAHCGGRYANLAVAHDPDFETAIEIHSSWGTFEWLLHDAFDLGLKVGIVAGSDDHKARPGASWPGSSLFGALGGLTCLLTPELTREAVFACLRERHHYATTGNRLPLQVKALFQQPIVRYFADPARGPCRNQLAENAMMGDIVHSPEKEFLLHVEAASASAIESLDIFNGKRLISTWRPYGKRELGRRIRVIWCGAEYRGRFRMSTWDGVAKLDGNTFTSASPINFFNPDKQLRMLSPRQLAWQSVTTGNFAGFEAVLEDSQAGSLKVETASGRLDLAVDQIGLESTSVDLGGLDKRIMAHRLPDRNECRSVSLKQMVSLEPGVDNPIYIRLTTEDGHRSWSSPIYLVPDPGW